MMDLMLYPELNPTLTAPSSTFSISPSSTFKEIGETITTITLTSTFNKGSINPAYGTTGFRSGDPNTYNYTGTGTSNNSSTSLTDTETISNYVIVQGANSWTGNVSYDAGPQPLTSKGNNYDSPLPAGTTSTKTRTITGVYPVFATTTNITTLTKQGLQSMTSDIQVILVAETNTDKHIVKIPQAWNTITSIQLKNPINNTFETIDSSIFTVTTGTETIQSNTVNYDIYTHNGPKAGVREFKFKV